MGKLKQIMIVNDDLKDIALLTELLERIGACDEVVVMPNGYEAIEHIRHRFVHRKDPKKGERLPDLILLDMEMPVMDGYEFMIAYNAHFALTKFFLPVYITSHPGDLRLPSLEKVYKGSRGYLDMPLTKEVLRRAVDSVAAHQPQKSWYSFFKMGA